LKDELERATREHTATKRELDAANTKLKGILGNMGDFLKNELSSAK